MKKTEVSKLVLVADDDEDIRAIVSEAIIAIGHQVIEAHDGDRAISLCQEAMPDLAVLDIMMPGCSGIEVCKFIKSRPGAGLTAVLMLTARDGLDDKVSALQDGADDYLTKPFQLRELQARVQALVRVQELTVELSKKNEELVRVQEELVKKERQLAVGQLAGTAAHNLGQPLSALLLNSHILGKVPADDPRFARALEAIKADVKRMSEMIEKLKSADADKKADYFEGTDILDLED